jgi:predicted nucleotidyltransferase
MAPLQSMIPGATGRVLGVLVQTTMPLSGRAIGDLAGVSPAQAARVLHGLEEFGIVEGRSAPPAILYSLVADHVATEPLMMLSNLPARFVERMAHEIAALDPRPASVGAYGSFARNEAGRDSDIDLLVVRPRDTADDDDWAAVVEAVRAQARRLSGNHIDILEVGQAEVPRLLRAKRPLWREIVRDFRLIYGFPLQDM